MQAGMMDSSTLRGIGVSLVTVRYFACYDALTNCPLLAMKSMSRRAVLISHDTDSHFFVTRCWPPPLAATSCL